MSLENGETATDEEAADEASEPQDTTEYPYGVMLAFIVVALVLSVFLFSLNQTIVATAIPKITNEFKSIDDISWYGSAFFMTLGGFQSMWGKFNSPKGIFVASVAEWFGKNGVTALVYDSRTLGQSDDGGWVDPNRIAIWGLFYSSGIALEAAAFDKRVKAVIAQSLMPYWCLNPLDEAVIVAHAIADRAKQLGGNLPEYIPLLNDKGGHLMHFKYLSNMTPEQRHHLPAWVHGAKKNARPSMTLFAAVSPKPVTILMPEDDEIVPPAFQRCIFDSFQPPRKKYEIVKGRGHMNILKDVNFDELLGDQLAFLKDVMKF
ncbi:hypothetical protein N7532_008077 [Penicillium argentinense]|uniref:Uncharacterized protein n=1 Tax=Penicillium argentinense TaxID=1131581 RepID=A0A9W9EWP6_9EURO|nr:uncharacterized protein N7532_008077 [Penicillium argentinense]KAJ5089393.1 hypothetical protein N7532_008077 [Penicillium argentinense]